MPVNYIGVACKTCDRLLPLGYYEGGIHGNKVTFH
jgi:hypothetical protein